VSTVQVILQEDVKDLGKKGDVVRVADGYARNFLLPRGLAVELTEGRLKERELAERQKERRKEKEEREAQELAARLKEITLRMPVRVGEQGRLFGSVTAKDVTEALRRLHGLVVDRRKLDLDEPIRHLGRYEVTVHLHPKVTARLRIDVTEE
jgi:large subunit ribosomal protein L9